MIQISQLITTRDPNQSYLYLLNAEAVLSERFGWNQPWNGFVAGYCYGPGKFPIAEQSYTERLVGDYLKPRKGIYDENHVKHLQTSVVVKQHVNSAVSGFPGGMLQQKCSAITLPGGGSMVIDTDEASMMVNTGHSQPVLNPGSPARGFYATPYSIMYLPAFCWVSSYWESVFNFYCRISPFVYDSGHNFVEYVYGGCYNNSRIGYFYKCRFEVEEVVIPKQDHWDEPSGRNVAKGRLYETRYRANLWFSDALTNFVTSVRAINDAETVGTLQDLKDLWDSLSVEDLDEVDVLETSRAVDVPIAWVQLAPTPRVHQSELIRKAHDLSKVPLYRAGQKLNVKSPAELALDATELIDRNSVNMIAFLRDLRDPKSLIPKLANLASLKTASNNYLATKYGILPTISDLQGILAAFEKEFSTDINGFRTVSSGHSARTEQDEPRFIVRRVRCKLAYLTVDEEFQTLAEKLRNWGFYPSFQNLWDLVPYSFVIDWFVDVGSLLKRIDTIGRLAKLPIKYTTMSDKITVDITSDVASFTPSQFVIEDATQTFYNRWVQHDVPRTSSVFKYEGSISAQDHILEASALIYQRRK